MKTKSHISVKLLYLTLCITLLTINAFHHPGNVTGSIQDDDDTTGPIISITYRGRFHQDRPGAYLVIVEDQESGLDEIQIFIDGISFIHEKNLEGMLTKEYLSVPVSLEPVIVSPGIHMINVIATNNDKDEAGDQESRSRLDGVRIFEGPIDPGPVEYPPDYYPPRPHANTGPDQMVNVGEAVSFDGSGSTTDKYYIIGYVWDFGDGTIGYGVNPTHIYLSPGIYTISLTVHDVHWRESTDTLVVTVILPVEAPLFSIAILILPIALLIGTLIVFRNRRGI